MPDTAATRTADGDGDAILDWPFFWITRTSARFQARLEQALRDSDLDLPRWRVLISLDGTDFRSVTEISNFTVMKLSTATKVVQRMMADGLVTTRTRSEDHRVTEVALTETGIAKRALAVTVSAQLSNEGLDDLNPDECEELTRQLERIFLRLAGNDKR